MMLSVVALASCNSDDDNKTWDYDTPTLIKCNTSAWTCAEGVIPFGSMVIYMSDVSLPAGTTAAPGDLIAAFVGNECRGVYTPAVNEEDNIDIVLTIFEKESDVEGATKLTIRYYSTKAKGYYESVPITYSSYLTLGQIDSPYKPTWQ